MLIDLIIQPRRTLAAASLAISPFAAGLAWVDQSSARAGLATALFAAAIAAAIPALQDRRRGRWAWLATSLACFAAGIFAGYLI
ncbi:MAG: hypothetical protein V7607_2505 [Solirubrobacteraceae bacterium]